MFFLGFLWMAMYAEICEAKQEHPRLVVEALWGDNEGELSEPYDAYEGGGGEYFFVEGRRVFVVDNIKHEILMFLGNKYLKSFDVPSDHVIGFVVNKDVLYYFLESGGTAFSFLDNKYLYYTSSPYKANYETRIYLSGNEIVLSNSAEMTCYDFALNEKRCDKMNGPITNQFNNASHLGNGEYALSVDSVHKVFLYDKANKIIGSARVDEGDLKFDVPGSPYVTADGVYYVKHNKRAFQIWYQPWERK